jgi:hypothetical protein
MSQAKQFFKTGVLKLDTTRDLRGGDIYEEIME